MEARYIHSTTDSSIQSLFIPAIIRVMIELTKPQSVLDVGCGLGHFVSEFRRQGIDDVFGIDGDYVPTESLAIEPKLFKAHNLEQPFALQRQFDLAICLEVAEHLDYRFSDILVQSLASHSDMIAFSAAFPGQGGQNHVNEQWKGYWSNKFADVGYLAVDAIRPRLLGCHGVPLWYKYNCMLYIKASRMTGFPIYCSGGSGDFLEHFLTGQAGLTLTTRATIAALRRAVSRAVRRLWPKSASQAMTRL